MTSQPIVCPQGTPSDRIQKVSSIYSEGTGTASYTGDYDTMITHTALAASLAPPPMPKVPSFAGWYIAVTFITIALFFAPVPLRAKKWYLAYLLLSLPVIMLVFVGVALVSVRLLSAGETTINAIAVIAGIAWGLSYLVMNYSVLTKAKREQTVYYTMVAYPTWVEKREKWQRLYYCFTHDYVFNPDTQVCVSPPTNRYITLLS